MKMPIKLFLKLIPVSIVFFILAACDNRKETSWQGYVDVDMLYISPESGGTITQIFVGKGDEVKGSEKLFELYNVEYLAECRKAEAGLKKANSELQDILKGARTEEIEKMKARISRLEAVYNLSNIEHGRYKLLYGKDAVSKKDYDVAEWNSKRDSWALNEAQQSLKVAMLPARKDLIDAAREKVKTAENSLKAAKWRLEQRTVYAKNNARVFDIYLRKGEYAAPNSPVISLIDRENIKVRFFVRYADAARLKIGDEVEFMTEKSGEKYPAVINYISQKPEYTPPVIYSRENTEKLLFMVEACPVTTEKETLNPGLPVLVKPVKNGK